MIETLILTNLKKINYNIEGRFKNNANVQDWPKLTNSLIA